MPIGSHLSRYKTLAQLAAATLQVLGVQAEKILTVPAPSVQKDRTYAAVLEVKKQLAQKGLSPASIDIVSFGPHSRRTWMMFKLIFSPGVQVGVISIEPRDYDVSRWWISSAGVRDVISETVAYLYARLIFSPPACTKRPLLPFCKHSCISLSSREDKFQAFRDSGQPPISSGLILNFLARSCLICLVLADQRLLSSRI